MHVCLYSVFSGEKGGEEETCREHPQLNGALEESDLWPKSEDLPFFSLMKVAWKRVLFLPFL